MRILCCLCFNKNEEEEEGEKSEMKEVVFDNDGKTEATGRNEESDETVPLEFALSVPDKDHLLALEDSVKVMRGDCANWNEVASVGLVPAWKTGPRSVRRRAGRPFPGESSASAAEVDDEEELEGCDRYSHYKRAKVHSDVQLFHYGNTVSTNIGDSSSSAYEDFNISQFSSKKEIFQRTYLSNYNDVDNLLDLKCEGDDEEGDGSGPSRMDDSNVQMDLTDDLLHMVFSFLDHVNLCRSAIVCRQWRAASTHEDFWRCLNFENRSISVEQFEDMCRRYRNATEVNISGAPSIHLLVMKAVTFLRNLEALTLGKGLLGDTFFLALADCHVLKSLNVTDVTLGNGLQEILINHDKLRHLQLTKCRMLRLSIKCPQLEILSLKRSNMSQATVSCPLLRELDIGSCHKLSDAAIRSAATSCPQLEILDMSNCSSVSDETLREIALSCGHLHILNASYCPNISLEAVRLPMLTVLKLDCCEGITSASMAAISHSYMLEVLELDNCGLLTSVSLDLPRLQNIRLVHCRKFDDLNLRTRTLSSIMVSNCPTLRRINITSNSLQKLALPKQECLKTLALQCPRLQEVDLTDCDNLTNSICEVFSDGGGCPMLRSLILDNCESLTAVGLASTSLINLSLVGCRAITSLDLTCPFLEHVHLDGCDHLEAASFCPVGLRQLNLGICPKLSILRIEAPLMVLLELEGCGVLSEASINCPLMTSLDASFCSQLKDDCLSATAASCPLIESLILTSCPSVGSDGLYSLRWLPHLTMLDLSYTFLMNLQPVFESCLQLKVLKLQACKYLTNLSLEPIYKEGALPALDELDLSYGSLCQSAIEDLLACCTRLTHLSLNGCVNMHDLNWGASSGQISGLQTLNFSSSMLFEENMDDSIELPGHLLENLNCVGCPNIRKVLIPSVARFFHLSSLNLSLSANVKEVDLTCFNLCFLNLSNCCTLEILKLECPKLTSLFLQSCNVDEKAVEIAISKCSMLETLDIRYCPKMSPMSIRSLRAACPSLKRIFNNPANS